ncbi:MAG: hypothetical protein AAFQ63_12240 [Cyanobacteria bacterium J06621_11]
MKNFLVTQSTDNGKGSTERSLSWAIQQANNTAGDDTITLTTDVTLSGEMSQLIDSNVTLEGTGVSNDGDTERNISGNDSYRPLFIKSGTVTINNIDIVNGLAHSGNITLSNVELRDNAAQGGNGGGYGNGGSFRPLFSGGNPGSYGSVDLRSYTGAYGYTYYTLGPVGGDGGEGGMGGFGSGDGTGGYGGAASAVGGSGGDGGAGEFGGGLFALHVIENTNGNNAGMPSALPRVTVTSVTFSGNIATDADNKTQVSIGIELNTHAVFGTTVLIVPEGPRLNQIVGTSRRDVFSGTKAGDELLGLNGSDVLSGDRGADVINGGNGNDRLLGEQGNDRLEGGEGRDILIGGGGRDKFVIASDGRLPIRDVISDFRVGQDRLAVTGLSFGALSFKGNQISITETLEVIAQLTGIDTTTLTFSDFAF